MVIKYLVHFKEKYVKIWIFLNNIKDFHNSFNQIIFIRKKKKDLRYDKNTLRKINQVQRK